MPAFIASFSVNQSQSGETLTLVDTSNYTAENQSTFTARKWYLFLSDGSTMLADGSIVKTTPATAINFPFTSGNSIDIPLGMDYGFNIMLELTSNNPQTGSVYTAQTIVALTAFQDSFLQSQTQGTQSQSNLENDTNYKQSWRNFYTNIVRQKNAQTFQALSSIQAGNDANYAVMNKQSFYF